MLAAFKAVAGAVKDNTSSLGKASTADVTVGLYYLFQLRQLETDKGNQIKASFKEFDADKSATISREKLTSVLKALDPSFTDEELDLLFEHADKNKDGVIQYDEFLDFLMFMDVPEAEGQKPVSQEEISKLCDCLPFAECAYSGDLGYGDTTKDPASTAPGEENFERPP